MTIHYPRRALAALALLCAAALPLAAQAPTDSALARRIKSDVADSIGALQPKLNLRSKRAIARVSARADSITRNPADTVRVVRVDTVFVTKPDTSVIVIKPDTQPAPVPGPVPGPTPGDTARFDGPAELPRATVDVTLPTGYTAVDVPAGANIQTAINASACRVVLRLAPATPYGLLSLPQKPCNERIHTIIQTNNGLAPLPLGTRVTPELSASRRQAMIVSKDAGNTPALLAEGAVHGYYFLDVAFLAQGTQPLNAILYLGRAQTSLAQVPYDLVFRGVYIAGTTTLAVRRCVYLNSGSTAFVDSWLSECHSNDGDSQAILGLNGPGPYLIQNNYLEAGHEVVMFGGGDPSIPNLVPSDITLRGNHITRPTSWKGVWGVKNLVETKNARRMVIEGNIIENAWADGQVGYALLFKSVNQDGTAPWSTTQDLTVRYNVVRNTGAGINLCAACQGTVVPAARMSLHDNVIVGVNVGPYTGEKREWQFLGALANVAVLHNTTINAVDVETAISFDGQPPKITGLSFRSNAYDNGAYGTHGGAGGSDWRLWADTTTSVWSHNLNYAPGSWAASGFDARGVYSGTQLGHDGKPVGADAAKVYAMTAGVVVRDPSRALGAAPRRVATPKQSGYRPTTAAQRKYNTEH